MIRGLQTYTFDHRKCAELRVGDHVFIQGRPCRILRTTVTTANEGCEIRLHGVDIFSAEDREGMYSLTEVMDVPVVERIECRLVSGPS